MLCFTGINGASCAAVITLLVGLPSALGRGVIALSSTILHAPSLLENNVVGSADAAASDVLKALSVSGLADLVELAAEDEATEVLGEEKGEKTVPNTRFAFLREASLFSCMGNRKGFLGSGVGG